MDSESGSFMVRFDTYRNAKETLLACNRASIEKRKK